MNKKQKKMLTRIIIAAVLMIAFKVISTFVDIPTVVLFIMYMVPYLVIGYDILRKAIKGILNRQVFDENFLMAVATVGAIIIALVDDGDFTEAIAVMLFYQIGELFQNIAVGKSRKNISELMDIRPDYANIEVDGKLEQVDPDEVELLLSSRERKFLLMVLLKKVIQLLIQVHLQVKAFQDRQRLVMK